MVKNLVSAFLIVRLELRRLTLDPDLILLSWRSRPAIHFLARRRESLLERHARHVQKLDEVYPF